MDKLKKRLAYLNKSKDQVKNHWNTLQTKEKLSTKEKLEKLVSSSLKQKTGNKPVKETISNDINPPLENDSFYMENDYFYPFDSNFGNIQLSQWKNLSSQNLAVICNNRELNKVDWSKIVFFDTETTGLSGGTGTIAFMLGFGYFSPDGFCVTIFTLTNLAREEDFLSIIDNFLAKHEFSATSTYNGKCFDFPLMETRYILQRKRFPLLTLPHLDLLFPARIIWKNTFESRRLGFLGEKLFNISREDDIDGNLIPSVYFAYLRNKSADLLNKVIEHNALDLVGLAALLILINNYLLDTSTASDDGEILGIALLYDKYGDINKAKKLLSPLSQSSLNNQVIQKTLKKLSIITKKDKNYKEAISLWENLTVYNEYYSYRELAVHYEHREKDYNKAMEIVTSGLSKIVLTESQLNDFNKRKIRIQKKISRTD